MLLNKALILSSVMVLSAGLLQAQVTDNTTTGVIMEKAGNDDQAEERKVKYLMGLRKIASDKELQFADSLTEAKGFSKSDIRFLSPDYKKLHPVEFQSLIDNSNYELIADTYVDSASVVRARVVRPSTKMEQQKAIEDLRKLVDESSKSPQGQEREKIIAMQLKKSAPLFSVVDVDGVKYDLSQLKGKVVVLNFWFIGCAPCKREVPELNALVEKYKTKDVVFLAFEVNDNTAEKVKAVARGFNYTQIPSTRKPGDVAAKYKIKTYPTSYVIDQAGIIRFGLAAYNPFKLPELDKTIETLLAKKPGAK